MSAVPAGPADVRAVVLAAGEGRRFGGDKQLAQLRGRPLLQHVLDALSVAGIDDPIVVLGANAAAIEPVIEWRAARRVVNPSPADGLATSVQLGWSAAMPADAVLLVLGDQPHLAPSVVRALVEAPLDASRPIVAPRYADGGGRNPVRVEAGLAPLVARAAGDRGLGPILDAHPALVRTLEVPGANPDVDRPEDLASLEASPPGLP